MSWLNRLLGRKGDHEAWLRAHPGKGAPKAQPPLVSDDEAAATRSRMEAEIDGQRERREGA